MRTLRSRLILSHLVPLVVVLTLVGWGLTRLVETQVLLAEQLDRLEEQAVLVATVASRNTLIWTDSRLSQEFLDWVGETISSQVMLLDTDGRLLAASPQEPDPGLGETLDLPGFADVVDTGSIVRVEYGTRPGTGGAEVLAPVVIGGRVAGVLRLIDPLSSLYERFAVTRRLIWYVLGVGLLLGVVAALVLASRLGRPLRRASDAMSSMAQSQVLSTIPEEGPEEVRILMRAFNTLVRRLSEVEAARHRLLANLVHELGRPLGALLSAVQAQKAGAGADAALRDELLDGMESQMGRMSRLLDNLTHLYDQGKGAPELSLESIDLATWLAEVTLPWREAAADKGIGWQTQVEEGIGSVDMDPDRLAQAVGNVASNAIKYSPPGGEVIVAAGADGEAVWISVRDSGPGIAAEEQERVFAPFYRGQTAQRFPQGMGLGLSIALDVVEAHGGHIVVHSEPPDGSEFVIWLPRSMTAASDSV